MTAFLRRVIIRNVVALALICAPVLVHAQEEGAAPDAAATATAPSTAPADGLSAARQAYIVDFDTGAVLLEKNANERMPKRVVSASENEPALTRTRAW